MIIMSEIELRQLLNKLGEEVLESKIQRMKNLLKIAPSDEALYREIMLSLGYPKNKVQFLELALLLPYKEIQKLKTQPLIEKALLYRAGFIQDNSDFPGDFDTSLRINKSNWVYEGVRPPNFPENRIKGIAQLLSLTTKKGIYNYFQEQIEKNYTDLINEKLAKKIVESIMSFKGIGISKKKEMFFNVILPFYLSDDTFSKYHHFLLKIFETHPPLDENSTIRKFYKENQTKITNAKEYFGAIKYIKR